MFDEIRKKTALVSKIVQEEIGATLKHGDYPSIKAFVVFDSLFERNQIYASYKARSGDNWIYAICPCCRPEIPR
jgi:hypothetical protein